VDTHQDITLKGTAKDLLATTACRKWPQGRTEKMSRTDLANSALEEGWKERRGNEASAPNKASRGSRLVHGQTGKKPARLHTCQTDETCKK